MNSIPICQYFSLLTSIFDDQILMFHHLSSELGERFSTVPLCGAELHAQPCAASPSDFRSWGIREMGFHLTVKSSEDLLHDLT
jgi:hypothetical protein